MKRLLISIAALILVITLSSCGGGGFKSDVRKTAKMRCERQKLEEKADSGDEKAKKDLENLEKEIEIFSEKMRKKYEGMKGDEKMKEEFRKIMAEEMANCK